MRGHLSKGGIWKNVEDEVLKVAVMKYGLNQWARISSLLSGKTPKQCKARWANWLDPGIKKTEWTREEEEKLLHLAKIFPTQWRTIAPVVGRTPMQCLEHYEKLLDAAQGADEEGEEESALRSARRLRPGEIDPFPETKPARPDPIDMNEDEKEMLNEARARMANTKGKKAKRKAREKQLEDARRLAQLQKRKELRAAGITPRNYTSRKNRGKIDYAREVPYEQQPPSGFYEVSAEDERALEIKQRPFRGGRMDQVEGRSRQEIEAEKRREDAARQAKRKEMDLPGHLLQVARASDVDAVVKRTKLHLPGPQLTDEELERTVKAGVAGDALLGAQAAMGATPLATPMRTPMRTPMGPDRIMQEARNLMALDAASNPLQGGQNPVLEGTEDYAGVLPSKSRVAATPNTLAASASTPAGAAAAHGLTPSRTPIRDSLGINSATPSSGGSVSGTPVSVREARVRERQVRAEVKRTLAQLPRPQNEYVLPIPELEPEAEQREQRDDDGELEHDAGDADRERRSAAELAAREARLLRSQVIQRSLPRPLSISAPQYSGASELAQANALLMREVAALLARDAAEHPMEELKLSGRPEPLDKFSLDELARARALIDAEAQVVRRSMGHGDASPDNYAEAARRLDESTLFVPGRGLIRESAAKPSERIESLRKRFEGLARHAQTTAKHAEKLEQKLAVTHGGYEKRAAALSESIAAKQSELDEAVRRMASFQLLQAAERESQPLRVARLRELVEQQAQRHRELQQRYDALRSAAGAAMATAASQS